MQKMQDGRIPTPLLLRPPLDFNLDICVSVSGNPFQSTTLKIHIKNTEVLIFAPKKKKKRSPSLMKI